MAHSQKSKNSDENHQGDDVFSRSAITARSPPGAQHLVDTSIVGSHDLRRCKVCNTSNLGIAIHKSDGWYCENCSNKMSKAKEPSAGQPSGVPKPKLKSDYICYRCKAICPPEGVKKCRTNSVECYCCLACIDELNRKKTEETKRKFEEQERAKRGVEARAAERATLKLANAEAVEQEATRKANSARLAEEARAAYETTQSKTAMEARLLAEARVAEEKAAEVARAREVALARQAQENSNKEPSTSGMNNIKKPLHSESLSVNGKRMISVPSSNKRYESENQEPIISNNLFGEIIDLDGLEGASQKTGSVRSNLTKLSSHRQQLEDEYLDIVRKQTRNELLTAYNAEEAELRHQLEVLQLKKEMVMRDVPPNIEHHMGTAANSVLTEKQVKTLAKSMTGSEKQTSIREWVDTSGCTTLHPQRQILENHPRTVDAPRILRDPKYLTSETARRERPYEQGIAWADLDRLRTTIIEPSTADVQANELKNRYTRSSTPAVLGSRTGTDFFNNINQSIRESSGAALTQVRQLLPEQLVARRYLPKELPTFSGDAAEWPKFLSTFLESQAHCNFSDRENLLRLQPALKGDALRLVEDLLGYPENLQVILSSLQNMYGNPEKVRQSVAKKLRALPAIKEDDLTSITWFANKIRGYCSTLKAARLESDLANRDYLSELEGKIPTGLRISWGLFKMLKSDCDLNTLANWLSQVGEATVTLGEPATVKPNIRSDGVKTGGRRKTDGVFIHHETKGQTNVSKLKVTPSTFAAPHEGRCSKCGGSHLLKDCGDFGDLTVNQRYEHAVINRLCFKCLEPHEFKECKVYKECGINNCIKIHHPLLHKSQVVPKTSLVEHTNHHSEPKSSVLFRIVPVKLFGPNNRTLNEYAFLDEGSSITLIEDRIAKQLEAEGPVDELCLRWTGSNTKNEKYSQRISLGISTPNDNHRAFTISDVRTVISLDLPTQSLSKESIKVYDEFKGLPIPTYQRAKPSLLIGLAHWKLGLPMESRETAAGLIATRSRLGWAVSGATGNQSVESVHFHECGCGETEQLNQLLNRFFTLESQGINSPERVLESIGNERARKILEQTIKSLNGGYQVGLLWRQNDIKLPDSESMARRRHLCLERKLSKDSRLYDAMRDQMADYLKKGYTRIMSVKEVAKRTPRTWYLPIFIVTNPNKPNKLRIVWDAAAKADNTCLNDALLSGPDLLSSLPGVLRRFREFQVAVTGDIREMFHQVRIRREDQDAQRFLWRNTPDEPLQTYIMQVMTFGATCSPSAAQYVKNYNAEKYRHHHPEAVEDIVSNHYVDDYVGSYRNEQDAAKVASEVRQIQANAGFELRKFNSNSEHVLLALNDSREGEDIDLSMGETMQSKVLGLHWDAASDTLYFKVNWNRVDKDLVDGTRRPTKREVLRHLMTIFDPLGLIANLLVQLKLLLQEVYRTGIDWDEPILEMQTVRWSWWINAIKNIENVRINRCYDPEPSLCMHSAIELHIFVDASERVYAAVAYLRVVTNGGGRCALVGAKTKLAPTKPTSIPRLELQAAVLGVRLATAIIKSHRLCFRRKVFWSDSQNVLHWINSESRNFKQYVAFRIGEILESSSTREWRYIPTRQNVADDCTKLKESLDLSPSSRWFEGPSFLQCQENSWPSMPITVSFTANEEMRLVAVHQEVICGNASPNASNISKWSVLVRSQARVLRLLSKKVRTEKRLSDELFMPEELFQSEMELIRTCQREAYPEECTILNAENAVLPSKNKLHQLAPFMDPINHILRIKTRIQNAKVIYETRNPILLPKGHRITRLIIDHHHRQLHHQFHEIVVNEIRQQYYVPHLRVEVKRVITDCQKCRNDRATPMPPQMGILPPARLAFGEPPFSYCGIDYFGPVELAFGRARKKYWGVLITCLTTRAVHLDMTSSLTSDHAVLVLQRFISKRGEPREIWCDNATTFRGVNTELNNAATGTDWKAVAKDYCQFTWHFITPAAPHQGGCWERMIRTVKNTLRRILKTQTPTPEVFRTALGEIENIINSRPLTYVATYPDCEEALTPNHILLGRANNSRPIGPLPERKRVPFNKMWQRALDIATQFWTRWVREYLPTLQRRTKWFTPVKPIEVGNIGVIWDSGIKNSWQLGRVVSISDSKDGQVRSLEIKTAKGCYRRPSSKFAKLDVSEPDSNSSIHEGGNVGEPIDNVNESSNDLCTHSDENSIEFN